MRQFYYSFHIFISQAFNLPHSTSSRNPRCFAGKLETRREVIWDIGFDLSEVLTIF